MPNPQQQLYKMLAQGSARGRDASRIHREAMGTLPGQEAKLRGEIEHLRGIIQQAGVGKNQPAEDRYLQVLHQLRQVSQLQAMNPVPTTVSTPLDPALEKALAYGELLLDVYGGGVLVKAATTDIWRHILTLRSHGDAPNGAIALELASDLEALL